MKYKKYLIWTVVGSAIFFVGWLMKDYKLFQGPISSELGRTMMGIGFFMFVFIMWDIMSSNLNKED